MQLRAERRPGRRRDGAPHRTRNGRTLRRKRRTDPVTALDERQRVLFGTMREWRNARSRREGVPAYVILTNRELVDVIRTQPRTLTALAAVEGIGPGKVERYGADILERLNGTPQDDGGGHPA